MKSNLYTVRVPDGLQVRSWAVLILVFTVGVLNAATIVHWDMAPTDGDNPVSLDRRTAVGEGVLTGTNPVLASDDHLWTMNGLGNLFPLSGDVPPLVMFANGNDGGSTSFNAGSFSEADGIVFFPADQYGDEFSIAGPFSLEIFFKSFGDQSGVGPMQLLLQGGTALRFGLSINEGGPGIVRFNIKGSDENVTSLDLGSRNYADGTWHYLLAAFDPGQGNNGVMKLTIANEDGLAESEFLFLDPAFSGLPAGGEGDLLIGRDVFSLSENPKTFLGLIDEVQITSGIVSPGERLGFLPITPVGPLARWNMEFFPGANPVVLDTRIATGQGTRRGASGLGATADHLWTMNALSPSEFLSSPDVPPLGMFANGNDGGFESFDAAVLGSVDGALYFDPDQYGNEFSFINGFSIELFFKTHGDQSMAGVMQLLKQGEMTDRYGVTVNEAGPGAIQLTLRDGSGASVPVKMDDRNYADGMWHYLLASYQPNEGGQWSGLVSITLANEDGSANVVSTRLPESFRGLNLGDDGKLLLGRKIFLLAADPRTFLGLIDEVQLFGGLPAPTDLLGVSPGPAILLTSTTRDDLGRVNLIWTSSPGANYSVEYAEILEGNPIPWTLIENITATENSAGYTDSDPTRNGKSQGYYRVRSQ